ncbi:MAG: hypothetical protein M0P61_18550 [Ignavibacteriaceae bacterium]|jgi:hypothetical protein|nr:hypothetical protein [Ignavibacteriaceae bacterium]
MIKVSNAKDLYPHLRKLLGGKWIETSIEDFYKKRLKISEKSVYNPEIENLEKHTHPLIRDVLSHLKLDQEKTDISLLPNKCKAHLELMLLDRDIRLLSEELSQNQKVFFDYKNGLSNSNSFDQIRFELFVAANFKLNGFEVFFIPRKSKDKIKTHEFNVSGNGIPDHFQVECKQRYQREPDYQREKFLYLLTENLFPRFFNFKISNIEIEVGWKGTASFGDVKTIADSILEKVIGLTNQIKYKFKTYEITIRSYKLPLPKFLNSLQKNVPNYVTTEDAYLVTHKSIFLIINRDFGNTIVKKVRTLYGNAKDQFSLSDNRLVYIDIGTMPISVINELERSFKAKPPTGVGVLTILKSQLHINDKHEIVFTPYTQIVWNRKLIKPFPGINLLPGFVGESGFDSYIQSVL